MCPHPGTGEFQEVCPAEGTVSVKNHQHERDLFLGSKLHSATVSLLVPPLWDVLSSVNHNAAKKSPSGSFQMICATAGVIKH